MKQILKPKKTIFFDMGNTLLDFHRGPSDEAKDLEGLFHMQKYMEALQIKVSIEALRAGFLEGIYKYHRIRVAELREVDVKPLLEDYGEFSEKEKMELLSCFYKPYAEHIHVNEGAKDLLKDLKEKQFEIGIISNCYLPGELYKTIFKATGLDVYIDHYTFSYDVIFRKPRREIFDIALTKTESEVSECIMIGDGLKPDIMGAQNVGMDSIWYNGREPVLEIEHLKGIVTSFKALIY